MALTLTVDQCHEFERHTRNRTIRAGVVRRGVVIQMLADGASHSASPAFVDFLIDVVSAGSMQRAADIHVIVDNLATAKTHEPMQQPIGACGQLFHW